MPIKPIPAQHTPRRRAHLTAQEPIAARADDNRVRAHLFTWITFALRPRAPRRPACAQLDPVRPHRHFAHGRGARSRRYTQGLLRATHFVHIVPQILEPKYMMTINTTDQSRALSLGMKRTCFERRNSPRTSNTTSGLAIPQSPRDLVCRSTSDKLAISLMHSNRL